MCCSAWIQMSGLAVKRCWKWKVKNWKSITKWRSLGADHCRGRAALVVVTLQNRTTQRATRTHTGYHHDWGQRSKYAADRWKCALTCFWWVESSCPPADCWTYWPSLQTSDRKRNAFECKPKKMMQPVCLAKTQTVDNMHFSLCSYLHLRGCMSLIRTVSYLLFPKVSVCSLCTSPSAHTAASSCLKEVSWFHVLAYRQSLGFSLCY